MADDLERMLADAAAGDRAAMEALVGRFGPSGRRLAAALTGDVHLAEDALQSAFVVACTRLRGLRSPRAFGAWFRLVVRTEARRVVRARRGTDESAHPEPADRGAGPSESAEASERRALMLAAVAKLPPANRAAVEAHYLDGRSIADAARGLAAPPGTVKRRLHDARAKLRSLLGKDPLADD